MAASDSPTQAQGPSVVVLPGPVLPGRGTRILRRVLRGSLIAGSSMVLAACYGCPPDECGSLDDVGGAGGVGPGAGGGLPTGGAGPGAGGGLPTGGAAGEGGLGGLGGGAGFGGEVAP